MNLVYMAYLSAMSVAKKKHDNDNRCQYHINFTVTNAEPGSFPRSLPGWSYIVFSQKCYTKLEKLLRKTVMLLIVSIVSSKGKIYDTEIRFQCYNNVSFSGRSRSAEFT